MDLTSASPVPNLAPLVAGGSSKPSSESLPKAADPIHKSAQEFESMLLGVMLEPMFSGVKADSLFGGGQAEKVYQSLLVQEYAKSISANGGIGIADAVYKEMLKMQEHQ
jgi:peptidoglycan hydrolase FlgJ